MEYNRLNSEADSILYTLKSLDQLSGKLVYDKKQGVFEEGELGNALVSYIYGISDSNIHDGLKDLKMKIKNFSEHIITTNSVELIALSKKITEIETHFLKTQDILFTKISPSYNTDNQWKWTITDDKSQSEESILNSEIADLTESVIELRHTIEKNMKIALGDLPPPRAIPETPIPEIKARRGLPQVPIAIPETPTPEIKVRRGLPQVPIAGENNPSLTAKQKKLAELTGKVTNLNNILLTLAVSRKSMEEKDVQRNDELVTEMENKLNSLYQELKTTLDTKQTDRNVLLQMASLEVKLPSTPQDK